MLRPQVSNWFINARVRLWKPMVEEMYMEETKDQQDNNLTSSDGVTDLEDNIGRRNQTGRLDQADHKPTQDQLVRIDSECLSSIVNANQDKNGSKTTTILRNDHHQMYQQHGFGRVTAETEGAMELDFSSYNNHHSAGAVSYANNNANQSFNGGGVSLTLGLMQQHGGTGVSLAFSPASQSSLFYARDPSEECQTVQYSFLDSEGQNLPYRNLMGAQLLHDLAG